MKQVFSDSIYIIGETLEAAENIRSSVNLRGFDRVKCVTLQNASGMFMDQRPDLVLLDPGSRYEEALHLLNTFQNDVPVIFLAEAFDEDLFIRCFDAGARDFLVKPVNPSYLVSRVLIALDSRRLLERMEQRDIILRDLNAIGAHSNVFTTEYLVKMLKREVEKLSSENLPVLSLLIIQLEGFDTRLAVNAEFKRQLYHVVAGVLNRCCRGSDILGEYFEDKFAMILPNTAIEGGQSVARRVLERLDGQELRLAGEVITLRVRIGAADFTGCLHYEDLMNKAVEGLKQARREDKRLEAASG